MIRYKIRIECKGGLCYLRKEYSTTANVLKALYMINFTRFGETEIRVAKLINDVEVSLSEVIIL